MGKSLESEFDDRRLNDGAVEIVLIDLDRQDKIAADFYRQRDACLQEIKINRADGSKVDYY
jgi:sigma54-dependent transcription regulator